MTEVSVYGHIAATDIGESYGQLFLTRQRVQFVSYAIRQEHTAMSEGPTLRQLRYFLRAVDTGSFSAAAAAEYVAQPDEIARWVAILGSADAAFMTGETIVLSGGDVIR